MLTDDISRIADALQRIAANMEKTTAAQDRQSAEYEKTKAAQNAVHRLYALLQSDTRFPGLWERATSAPPLGEDVRDAVLATEDPAAVINYLMKDHAVIARLMKLEAPEDIATEISRIAQRLAMKAV